jgi:hypothetical protein
MKKEEYGEGFHEYLLEQYKLYVEMADRISNRRAQTNRFYVSLLSGLLALLSIVVGRNIFSDFQTIAFSVISVLGLTLCALWNINIRSYRQLNSGKFKVIHEMEQCLPFPCYNREWEILGEEQESKKYLQLTRVEQYVSFMLAIPYILLFLYSLWVWIK